MALIKNAPQTQPQNPVIDQAATVSGSDAADNQPVDTHTADAPANATALAPRSASSVTTVNTADLAAQGFEGLALDWTSFPTISLKTEGHFEDIEGHVYGKEFTCFLRGSKTRFIYRAVPVQDNKRDVAYSYDGVTTQDGILLQDKFNAWEAQGKAIEERTYLEALVEMIAPGESFDGEYRIVQISPTSKGRYSAIVMKAAAKGGGDASSVPVLFKVGPKVTKVQNPFYPFGFELA